MVPTQGRTIVLERDGYPPGVPCWVDTSQPDPEAAVRFYQGLFGWEFTDRMPSGSEGSYYVARLHGKQVAARGLPTGGVAPNPNWATYIWVDNAEETTAKAKEAGGTVFVEPFDIFDAGRMAVLSDPTGAVFSLWQAGTHRGAQLVNEANTWNWSDLNTRDPQVAKAFYEALFGWVADEVDLGDLGEATMLRRPGYGDFLEKLEPDIRSRQTEAGAPPDSQMPSAGCQGCHRTSSPRMRRRIGASPSLSKMSIPSPPAANDSGATC